MTRGSSPFDRDSSGWSGRSASGSPDHDPLAVEDLSPLGRIFAEAETTTVLHAGDNDLTHLKRRYGFRFASLFDTAVGARFLGAAALGLDVLLERYLGA